MIFTLLYPWKRKKVYLAKLKTDIIVAMITIQLIIKMYIQLPVRSIITLYCQSNERNVKINIFAVAVLLSVGRRPNIKIMID